MSGYTTMPAPTFAGVDSDDGAVSFTWCFGEQGHPDSWRVMYLWQPGEGLFAHKITHTPMTTEDAHGDAVGPALLRWLVSTQAKDDSR